MEEEAENKKGARSNRRRQIWDMIPAQGKTTAEIAEGMLGTYRATQQMVTKMVKAGYLIRKSGLQNNGRLVTYFHAPGAEPPSAQRGYKKNIATMVRDDGFSTLDLIDRIETKFLELGELMDQVRPRLITDELIQELSDLRALKQTVEASLNKTSHISR